MSLSKLAEFGTRHVAKGIGRLATEVIESGSGSYVTMTSGRKMLDFTCGIGVANLGHCHPAVTKAAQAQAGKMVHAQVCDIPSSPLPPLRRGVDPREH